jgi:predicted DNA-binding antitoxin AbrB/MazE fold protein
MSKTLAVFQDGVFKPLAPVTVDENQQVLLEITRLPNGSASAKHSESSDEWIARWRAMVASIPRPDTPMDDSRESIYAGRGE